MWERRRATSSFLLGVYLTMFKQDQFCRKIFWLSDKLFSWYCKWANINHIHLNTKSSYVFQQKIETAHQSNKSQRIIVATEYFSITLQLYFSLTMGLTPFNSFNSSTNWLSVLFWKRPTKPYERPPSSHPAGLHCQSAILFPDSTVISQPSGAVLPDLCFDLCLGSPSSSTSFGLESRLKPPLLIYEPFHTVLLPLQTQPWPTLQDNLLALNK